MKRQLVVIMRPLNPTYYSSILSLLVHNNLWKKYLASKSWNRGLRISVAKSVRVLWALQNQPLARFCLEMDQNPELCQRHTYNADLWMTSGQNLNLRGGTLN